MNNGLVVIVASSPADAGTGVLYTPGLHQSIQVMVGKGKILKRFHANIAKHKWLNLPKWTSSSLILKI